MELAIRFDYGRITPWVSRDGGALTAIAGPDRLVLRTPAKHRGEDFRTFAEFTVSAEEDLPFTLSYGPSHADGRRRNIGLGGRAGAITRVPGAKRWCDPSSRSRR